MTTEKDRNTTIAPQRGIPKFKQNGVLLTIYALFFISPTIAAISPAIASMTAAYPNVSPSAMGYVISITAIAQAITALLSGAIAGERVKFQRIIIPSLVLYLLAGCFPYFLADGQGFVALLVSRALFGAALGFLAPLGNALVMAFHDDEKRRASIIGAGNVAMNLGTIVTSLLAGFLCVISWQTTFLLHLLGAVLLVLAIVFLRDEVFIKNPALLRAEAARQQVSDDEIEEATKARLPFGVFGYLLMFLMMLVVTQPIFIYNATLLSEASIGDSTIAGIMASIFSVGGLVAAANFKLLFKRLKEWLCPVAFVIASISTWLGFIATGDSTASVILFGVAIFLDGFGLLMVTCFTPIAISAITPPNLVTAAMGMISFVMAAGSFIVTPFAQVITQIAGTASLRVVLLGSMATGVATALVLLSACIFKSLVSRRSSEQVEDLGEHGELVMATRSATESADEAVAAAEAAVEAANEALKLAKAALKAAKAAEGKANDLVDS